MQKLLFLFTLLLCTVVTNAQRFFYVEDGNMGENVLKQDLLKASQFVAKTPIVSEFIIRTASVFETKKNLATLQIIVEDTATFRTVFQAKEEYSCASVKMDSQLFLRIAMKGLIEKSFEQMILCAENNYRHSLMGLPTEKKDKT